MSGKPKDNRDEIERLRSAIVMIENRLECALMDDPPCKGCVEVAHSYAIEALDGGTPGAALAAKLKGL